VWLSRSALFHFQPVCVATVKFLAHLVNQQVLHELVALELLTLLLEDPSDDSVEVAVGFIKVRRAGSA
jgi:pre-mRNA-splicing factor CWC22